MKFKGVLPMKIGIEIEFTNVERNTLGIQLAKLLNSQFEMSSTGIGRFNYTEGPLKDYKLTIERSIQSFRKNTPFGDMDYEYSNELISKVIDTNNKEDLIVLQSVLQIINDNNGMVNDTCGLHIHIDQPNLETTKQILTTIHQSHFLTLGVNQNRLDKYCKPLPKDLINNLHTVQSLDELKKLWLFIDGSEDLHDIKYYMVNINQKNTIEFRWFNATLDFELIINIINSLTSLIDSNNTNVHNTL
jgi:hypothetical protein